MEFREYKLSELTVDGRGYYGIGASAVEFCDDKYKYLRITDISDNGTVNGNELKCVGDKDAHKYLLKKNDIVFARTGASTGKNYLYDGKVANLVFAGFLIKFGLNEEKVNPSYIKYYCLSINYINWVESVKTGSTRGNINEKQFGDMPIYLPKREYQNKVVKILSSLDAKIELNNKTNKNLYEIAINFLTSKQCNHEVLISDFAKIQSGYAFKSKDLVDNKTNNKHPK